MRSKEDLVSEEIKRKDKIRRDAINAEKRSKREYEELKLHRMPNEFRHCVSDFNDDFYLGD